MKINLLLINLFVFTTNLYSSDAPRPTNLYEVRIVFAKSVHQKPICPIDTDRFDYKFAKLSRFFVSSYAASELMHELNSLNSFPVTNDTPELTQLNMRKVFDKLDILADEIELVCPQRNRKTGKRIPPTSFYIEQIRKVITP